jgi:hypothetical protein
MVELGPTGTLPLGAPINAIDRGGCNVGFRIEPGFRLATLKFGTMLRWLAILAPEAKDMATQVRSIIINAFGIMPYDKLGLPLKVTYNRDKGIIEIRLPTAASQLTANPEMWLALCEVIEDRLPEPT